MSRVLMGCELLWLDFESYSTCDLKKSGARRYAEHLTTRIIVSAWAVDDAPVQVAAGLPDALRALVASGMRVCAHNAAFDRGLLTHVAGVPTSWDQWHDTQAQALAHGWPGSLGALGEALGLPADKAKDKRGASLIRLFCVPQPATRRVQRPDAITHPAEWADFMTYAAQDVDAMRECARRMSTANYPGGHRGITEWRMHSRINERGFSVDAALARAAVAACGVAQGGHEADVQRLTDGRVASSRQVAALRAEMSPLGCDLPDLAADTVRGALVGDLHPTARALLLARQGASKTSTAKYASLLASVCADGRIHGAEQWCGASRTGRVAHRLFQPGNLPRQSAEEHDIETWTVATLAGSLDLFAADPLNAASQILRGCIVAPPGKHLAVSDLSNIEGRVASWLAGEDWKLDAFRAVDAGRGVDMYVQAYARAMSVNAEDARAHRQIGKVMELALAYQGGPNAFATMAATYGLALDTLADAVVVNASAEALAHAQGLRDFAIKCGRAVMPLRQHVACQVLVTAWRAAHPAHVGTWAALQRAANLAVMTGRVQRVGDHLQVGRAGRALVILLPSGRQLHYQDARTVDGVVSYMGVDSVTRQWRRIDTYGGMLFENVTQAVARDVLFAALPVAEAAGYPPVLTVHDEIVAETQLPVKGLNVILSTNPTWAGGLPLAAAGFAALRYRK